MTTDTVEKMASARIDLGGSAVTIGGIAKGSGMIAPDMATLLVFVCTDAALGPDVLDHWTRTAADASFNCITVDGDTSTNDSLIVFAGGPRKPAHKKYRQQGEPYFWRRPCGCASRPFDTGGDGRRRRHETDRNRSERRRRP